MAEVRRRKIILNDEPKYEFISIPTKKRIKSTLLKKHKACKKDKVSTRKKVLHADALRSHVSETTGDVFSSTTVPDTVEFASDCSVENSLSAGTIYLQLLTSHKAVSPVDEDYRAFILQDLDFKKEMLKDDFVIIQRQVVKTPDGFHWLYGCSCNPARQRMLNVLSPTLSQSIRDDFEKPYEKCFHINAFVHLVSGFNETVGLEIEKEFDKDLDRLKTSTDEHMYGKHLPKIDLYSVESSDHVVCVRYEMNGEKPTFSVVKIDFKGQKPVLKCSSCNFSGKGCRHTDAVLSQESSSSDASHRLQELLNQKPKWRSRYIPVPVSATRIPFIVAPEEQKLNRSHLLNNTLDDGYIHLVPSDVTRQISDHKMPDLPSEKYVTLHSVVTSDIVSYFWHLIGKALELR